MSLYKQLWLAVILLMALAFSGSFLLTTKSAQNYLTEQLQLKNFDNATSLALSLSQQNDPVLRELLIAAQFDNSHYEFIRLMGLTDSILVEHGSDKTVLAPTWFMSLFPIEATPGIAQVTNGWQQIGTLSLKSDSRFAYGEMWVSTQLMFLYFLAGALFSGLIGNRLLKVILKPLNDVVDQSKAIGERRFITIKEPKTLEYRLLVQSMNNLSGRVKQLLDTEGGSLQELRKEAETDSITGLLNREAFMQQLSTLLNQGNENTEGSLVLLRLQHLAELNRSEGRDVIDSLLQNIGASLNDLADQCEGSMAGRLNGSDLVLLLPGCEQTEKTAQRIHEDIQRISTQMQLENPLTIPAAASIYSSEDSLPLLMTRIDAALASAEQEQRSCLKMADIHGTVPGTCTLECWHKLVASTIENQNCELITTPVTDASKQTLYMRNLPLIYTETGEKVSYQELHPWLSRLKLSPQLDLQVMDRALASLNDTPQPLSVSFSAQLLDDENSQQALLAMIKAAPKKATQLRIGFPEYGAYQHLESLQNLCSELQTLGCRVGIEQVGPDIASIGNLSGLGVDYVMVDEMSIHDINDNNARQIFLRGLCSISHSIGLSVIADGIRTEDEWRTAIKLGIDACTGSYFE
jgi:diguanylate cyclase (GGDEF)-like protein